jgi:hypothetical protein
MVSLDSEAMRPEGQNAMTTELPTIPVWRWVGCGGRRFVPLTFPRIRERNGAAPDNSCHLRGS